MALEKFRARIFVTSLLTTKDLTVTGTITNSGANTISGATTQNGTVTYGTLAVVNAASASGVNVPYSATAPGTTTLNANGGVMVAGTQRIYFKTGGTTYWITASGTLG